MSQSIEYRHVQLIVLFRSKATCSKLGYECGTNMTQVVNVGTGRRHQEKRI